MYSVALFYSVVFISLLIIARWYKHNRSIPASDQCTWDNLSPIFPHWLSPVVYPIWVTWPSFFKSHFKIPDIFKRQINSYDVFIVCPLRLRPTLRWRPTPSGPVTGTAWPACCFRGPPRSARQARTASSASSATPPAPPPPASCSKSVPTNHLKCVETIGSKVCLKVS